MLNHNKAVINLLATRSSCKTKPRTRGQYPSSLTAPQYQYKLNALLLNLRYKSMFAALSLWLTANPALRDIIAIAMIGFGVLINYETNKSVEELKVATIAYPYEVVSYSLSEISNRHEIVAMTQKWVTDHWSAQLAAAKVLCSQGDKSKLASLLGDEGAIDFCRITR